jgi:hypothetical protein
MSDEHVLQPCANPVSDDALLGKASDINAALCIVDAATDVHMPLPVTPKYKSSLPRSVSPHIINQREDMHCILIYDQ